MWAWPQSNLKKGNTSPFHICYPFLRVVEGLYWHIPLGTQPLACSGHNVSGLGQAKSRTGFLESPPLAHAGILP